MTNGGAMKVMDEVSEDAHIQPRGAGTGRGMQQLRDTGESTSKDPAQNRKIPCLSLQKSIPVPSDMEGPLLFSGL